MKSISSDLNIFLAIKHSILSGHTRIMKEVKNFRSSEWKKYKDHEGHNIFDFLMLSQQNDSLIKKWEHVLEKDMAMLIKNARFKNKAFLKEKACPSGTIVKKNLKKVRNKRACTQNSYRFDIDNKKIS